MLQKTKQIMVLPQGNGFLSELHDLSACQTLSMYARLCDIVAHWIFYSCNLNLVIWMGQKFCACPPQHIGWVNIYLLQILLSCSNTVSLDSWCLGTVSPQLLLLFPYQIRHMGDSTQSGIMWPHHHAMQLVRSGNMMASRKASEGNGKLGQCKSVNGHFPKRAEASPKNRGVVCHCQKCLAKVVPPTIVCWFWYLSLLAQRTSRISMELQPPLAVWHPILACSDIWKQHLKSCVIGDND